MRPRCLNLILPLITLCVATAVDQTEAFRQRYAIAYRLTVTSAEVDDRSAADGPVLTTMRCRLERPGTYRFHFDAVGAGGRAEVLTVVSPPPEPSRFASVLPGGIHGGPPRIASGERGPTLSRDDDDPSLVTIRWAHGDSAGRGPWGQTLARCDYAEPASPTTTPATRPAGPSR